MHLYVTTCRTSVRIITSPCFGELNEIYMRRGDMTRMRGVHAATGFKFRFPFLLCTEVLRAG